MTDKPSLFRLSKNEWRWPLAVAVVIMAATFLPYFFGWFITPPGMRYSGYLSNTDDHNVYLAYMRQAHDGRLVFTDQFTTEAQQPWFFHIFFLVLGLFSRLTGLSLIVTYLLALFVCGVLLLLALYVLAAQFFDTVWPRRFFLLFTAFASGFGWLYVLIVHPSGNQPHPPDFGPGLVMPELITFLTLLLNPLFCFAIFFLVSTLVLFAIALERKSVKLALLAGISGALLANIHSYDMIPLALMAILYVVGRSIMLRKIQWQEIGLILLVGALAFLPVIYQLHLYRDLPVFYLKAKVETLSPPVIQYLLALGIPFLLALPGAWLAIRQAKQNPIFLLPIVWFIATLISAYLPSEHFPFQRKMAEGMQIPVILLGTFFVSHMVAGKEKSKTFALMALLLIVLSFPSNLFYLRGVMQDLQTLGSRYMTYLMPPLYLRNEQTATLAWLNGRVNHKNDVLVNSMLGSYVPGQTGGRTFVGHWAETINYPKKLGMLNAFLSGRMPLEERRELLKNANIRYIIIGPEERALAGMEVTLTGLPVEEVHRVGEITVFQVK